MNSLQVIEEREVLGFNFTVYGTMEEPLFLAKDVAEWIDYNKTSQGYYDVSAMLRVIDENEKIKKHTTINNPSGSYLWFLTEDGLYEILMQSRKPIAKEFKKKVKEILKDLRKGNVAIIPNSQNDLFLQMMSAVTDVLSKNQQAFQDQVTRQIEANRNIITEQEIKHEEQIKQTRELIGFKSKNARSIGTLLKARISNLKGFNISARDDYHYIKARECLFSKYSVWKWEDIPIDRYDEVHADIDNIDDLEFIYFE